MKNILAVFLLTLTLQLTHTQLTAQEIPTISYTNAIGIRLPGGFAGGGEYGVEISYMRSLANLNRIEIDLGIIKYEEGSSQGLTGVYQWVENLLGGLNWYYGPGVSFRRLRYEYYKNRFGLGIGAQVGLEYNFNHIGTPLNITLDCRPMFTFTNGISRGDFGIALGARYTF